MLLLIIIIVVVIIKAVSPFHYEGKHYTLNYIIPPMYVLLRYAVG